MKKNEDLKKDHTLVQTIKQKDIHLLYLRSSLQFSFRDFLLMECAPKESPSNACKFVIQFRAITWLDYKKKHITSPQHGWQ